MQTYLLGSAVGGHLGDHGAGLWSEERRMGAVRGRSKPVLDDVSGRCPRPFSQRREVFGLRLPEIPTTRVDDRSTTAVRSRLSTACCCCCCSR